MMSFSCSRPSTPPPTYSELPATIIRGPVLPRPRTQSSSSTSVDPPKRRSTHSSSSSRSSSTDFSPHFILTPLYASQHPQRQHSISSLPSTDCLPAYFNFQPHPSMYAHALTPQQQPDSDDDVGLIYTSRRVASSASLGSASSTLRTRVYGGSSASLNGSARGGTRTPKSICTTPGHVCAGETETEIDEPPRHLPTTRIRPAPAPLVPPNSLTPVLFEFSRLLSIVPALLGTIYNIYHILHPPTPHARGPDRIDFFVAALWSLLTANQCLRLTTGLLTRWRIYYPPLPTLIRLLALQAICWPATHFTLKILGGNGVRPAAVWAVVGTTTSVSRSVQIWVTSNLWWEGGVVGGDDGGVGEDASVKTKPWGAGAEGGGGSGGYWRRWGGGKWGGRRWDWSEVGLRCILPTGIVYFVMAWAGEIRREWGGC